ncbi:uncharacterized protein N7496_008783 [Penicillium cataractarum]|uniref:Carbohydrate-binding module family 96 domain-containing protein n=1 Tax=Penicillium cataractarum TaxID=2100454 RepID=A0A9W9V4V6_9EURO|nr:uncharacterized protein N7496_008783 [Penicillium cataractarum]KAJ5369023.1 hypothetical protein N7496_008783 [Penicillium cataractarum]
MTSRIWAAALLMARVGFAATPVIDPTLKPSFPTVANISRVDHSLSTYDRIVLMVDEQPFFYNGVQLRIDKMAAAWNMTDAQIEPFFQFVANDGFTVINSQLTWADIQPDTCFNATESAYVRGGSYENTNYGANSTLRIAYESGNESNQALSYIKFDFSDYSLDQIDAAKVRIYVNVAPDNSAPFSANLYGIANNTWSASDITWANSPSHDGVNVSGVKNTDYWFADSSPSWDPINKASYYDFDASDFISNNCPDKIASFIFQSQVNSSTLTNGASLDGAQGASPPQLWLSSTNSWDFTHVDNMLKWAGAAGIKLEFIWFGSDSTSSTEDFRVPYFVFRHNLVQKVQSDGTVVPVMLKNQGYGYGVYWYLADKNDLSLRALEKTALKALMNHVAVYNTVNGDKKTLIGIDIANENSVTHIHGVGDTVWHNPATWSAYVNFSSQAAFVARTEWEYSVNLANGVKESNYPIWTRLNTFTTAEEKSIEYNEQMRLSGGTSLDFVGLDPYSTSTSILYDYGHQTVAIGGSNENWALGSNLPLVMENSGAASSAESLLLASLAGGAFYNVYEYMGPDNFGLYYPKSTTTDDFTPVARSSYVSNVVDTNHLLKSLALDLSSKRPSGANGTKLVYFNPFSNSTFDKGNILDFPVMFTPASTGGVGFGIVRSSHTILLASTRNATFNIDGLTGYGIDAVEYGYYSGGNFVANGTYPFTTSGTNITINATNSQLVHIQTKDTFPV